MGRGLLLNQKVEGLWWAGRVRSVYDIHDLEGIRTYEQSETVLAVMATSAIIVKSSLWQRTQRNASLGLRPTDSDLQKVSLVFSYNL
jgi:hypothetical protein